LGGVVTIASLLSSATKMLAEAGVDDAPLNAELMLAQVLGLSRTSLVTESSSPVPDEAREIFLGMLQRRSQREPLQHILGEAHFYGLVFTVNSDVLVPRPETELLVEQAVEFLRTRRNSQVFDFGTGSGCIPITIAKEVPEVRIWSVDISEAARSVAKSNAEKNGVADRIQFLLGDGFDVLDDSQRFDLIVSNPPYIPTADLKELQPEVRDFDPALALDGGADGLDFYRRLAREAGWWLVPGGKIMIELGHDQAVAVRALFESEMWIVENVLDDYSRIPRILIARPTEPVVANS
jgi:release factor glutamine methyltransferase